MDLRNREVRENCRILATVGKDPLELPPLQVDAQAPVPVLGVEITPGSPKFEYIARKLGGLLILYLESLSKSKETPTTIICGTSLHNREGQPAYLLLFLGAWSTYEFNSYSFSFASPERVERFRLLASSCVFLGAVGYPVHEFDVAQANTRRLEVLKSVVTTLILDLEILRSRGVDIRVNRDRWVPVAGIENTANAIEEAANRRFNGLGARDRRAGTYEEIISRVNLTDASR